jgi:hypothetical protein
LAATAFKSNPARRRKKRKRIGLGMLWLLPAVLLLSSSLRDSDDSEWPKFGRIAQYIHDPALSTDSGDRTRDGVNRKGPHRVYPFSIVPGGVHGREELADAISRDSLIERHYSDFDVSKTRVVKLAAAKTAYVSYRLNNKVYWTKNKITLAKGEQVLSDGTNYARTRCGNRISENDPGETSDSEPSPEALDTPIEDLILEGLIASELPDDRPVYSGPEFTPELVDALLGSNLRGADDPFSAVINSFSSSVFNPEFAGGPTGFPGDYFVPAQNGRDGDPSVTPFAAPRSDLHDPGEYMGAALNVPETDSFVFVLMGLVSLAIHRYAMTKRKVRK